MGGNIKMDLREVGYDDRDWINLAQDRDRWRAYVRLGGNEPSGSLKAIWSSAENYPEFALKWLRETPGKNLNQTPLLRLVTYSMRDKGAKHEKQCKTSERVVPQPWKVGNTPHTLRLEIYCTPPRYGMSCVPTDPLRAPTPLTTGPYSQQSPCTTPASATSPKAPLMVRGESPPPRRYAPGSVAEAIHHRMNTIHGGRSREPAASEGGL
ncbi:hypothetical protein ANN_09756 [Periplaneta americana]|uniref:Uncharacterized protein n=1 Tax=Periplaneta americana TaxID=6978 RepID=A0ABQ8TM64_PERAM|nr:hypothetical protein ANN_09756 [Periplaneta americana]